MFGRKKKTKKQDLDWQPTSEASVQDDPDMRPDPAMQAEKRSASSYRPGTDAPSLAQPAADQARYKSASDGAGGDTWAGLIHPLSIARFLFGNLRTILTVAMIVLIGGIAVYMIVPAKYGTTALILVDPRQPRVTNSEAVLSGIGGDAAALTSYVEVMNSDGFLGKVVDELDVKSDPDFANATSRTELIGMFRSNLSAYRQGATYIVEVYYKSKSKENAAKYANGVAEAFVRDQKDFRAATSADASRWLSERLTLLQANLKKSEDAVAAYQARSGIVNAGAQGTLDDQQLASRVQQLANATTELAEARARYLQASKNGEPASANNSQSNQFTNLDQLLQEQDRLRRQAAELNQTLGSRHPRMLANAEQQRIIAGQIAQERRRLVQRTKQAFETAEAKKQSLERQLADARQRAIEQNKARVELANLERQANANRNLYEQFLERYKITDEQSNFQFSEARIVSAAPVPIKSTKPSLKLVVPVLLILGAFLGLLWAMIRQALTHPMPQAIPEAQAQRESYAPSMLANEPSLAEPSSNNAMACPPEELLDAVAARDTEPSSKSDLTSDLAPESPSSLSTQERLDVISEDGEEQHDPLAQAFDEAGEAGEEAEHQDVLEPEAQEIAKSEALDDMPDDRVVHLEQAQAKARQSARAGRIAAATKARDVARAAKPKARRRTRLASPSVLMTMPHHDIGSRDRVLDTMLETHQARLQTFLAAGLAEDHLCLLVAAAQDGVPQDATSDLFREFAIDEGFHPVVITLQEQADHTGPAQRQGGIAVAPERVARLQEFEGFDQIPFLVGAALDEQEGIANDLAQELKSLLTLCKDRYGFVILETHQVAQPAVLEDLIDLVDTAVLVLDQPSLQSDEIQNWQDWAEENAVGLVMDQTQN